MKTRFPKRRERWSIAAMLCAACLPAAVRATEPALFATLEDGNLAVSMPAPDVGLPSPVQNSFSLPLGPSAQSPLPHGVAFLGGHEALFADFGRAVLYRAALAAPASVQEIALTGRSTANGSLATSRDGRHALSIGEGAGGVGESVVVDFGGGAPVVSPITPRLRVLGFVTAAIDFAPDGRAFVCHTSGVSVLSPPYTTVDFTMTFPTITQSPSMCRLARDGSRLFVTRVLSETVPTVNGVRTTAAPFSSASTFVAMPAPASVQGLGPMAVSPDGQALIVAQQFLFPQAPLPPRARAFLLRAPFDAQTAYQELALPAGTTGTACSAEGNAVDCPGFEHIEVSDDGRLAIFTGNSSATLAGVADRVPAVFLRNPFDDATRAGIAVQVAPAVPATSGRGTGAVRFQPAHVFADGLETP